MEILIAIIVIMPWSLIIGYAAFRILRRKNRST